MATLQLVQSQLTGATAIPATGHREAGRLNLVELERFLDLAESLTEEEWGLPTGCTEWAVRDIVAHQAGCAASYVRLEEFRRQVLQNPYKREGEMMIDGINRCQVQDRAGRTPAELIAELREMGPQAIGMRQRLPWLLRKLPVPFGPPVGTAGVEFLTDVILPRDIWMHRLDICRATGRPFVQTTEHDGRLVALVVREVAQNVAPLLDGKSVVYELTGGPAGGSYRVGPDREPAAVLTLDVLDFNWRASERVTGTEALAFTSISGDRALAEQVLERTIAVY